MLVAIPRVHKQQKIQQNLIIMSSVTREMRNAMTMVQSVHNQACQLTIAGMLRHAWSLSY